MICTRCGLPKNDWHNCPTNTHTPIEPLPIGWECPRCRQVWAPHIAQCSCPAPTMTMGGNYDPLTGLEGS